MDKEPCNGQLSARGEQAVELGSALQGFRDVLDNLWHPELNPDGYVSLGIAENVSVCDSTELIGLMTDFALLPGSC